MTRMSREFSLVLLGAGILSAGYFAAPSPDEELEKKADEQAAARVGHSHGSHRTHGMFLFVHSPGYAGYAGNRSPAVPNGTTRGGFGGMGKAVGAGGGA